MATVEFHEKPPKEVVALAKEYANIIKIYLNTRPRECELEFIGLLMNDQKIILDALKTNMRGSDLFNTVIFKALKIDKVPSEKIDEYAQAMIPVLQQEFLKCVLY